MWLSQAGVGVCACSVTPNSLISILHIELMFYMIGGGGAGVDRAAWLVGSWFPHHGSNP